MAIRRLALILTSALILAAVQPSAWLPTSSSTAVGCTEAELATALAAGGSITFDCGPGTHSILFTTPLLVTTSANIDGADQITLSGQNITSLFQILPGGALALTHLTVTKGFADFDGGAIQISSGGSLMIDNCTFSDNHAGDGWSGGAIMSRGALTISNSTFDHNSAGNGGALNPRDGSSSTDIRNTLFLQNSTTNTNSGWGGAMLVWVGAAVTVENSRFISNTANSGLNGVPGGGAIYVTSSSSLTVDSSQFAGNSAVWGGALYIEEGGQMVVNFSDLHDNFSGVFDFFHGGGAIYNAGNLLADTDQLHGNHADGVNDGLDGEGGAIFNDQTGFLLIQNSVLRRNFAFAGGAIETWGSATVLTSTLVDNTAQAYDGAILAFDISGVSKDTDGHRIPRSAAIALAQAAPQSAPICSWS